MKKVLCVGSAIMDVLVQSDDFRVMKSHQVPGGVAIAEVYGGKTEAKNISLQTGGAGTNVAVGLSRLGLVISTVTRVGNDWIKDLIINDLKLEKVDVSLIQVDKEERTGMSVVLIAADGGRSIVTYRGASKKISSAEIGWEKVSDTNWVQIAALGGNMALAEDVVSFSVSKKIPVGWNPGKGELSQQERIFRLLPKIDLLVLNRMEAAQLVRQPYEQMKEMAIKIAETGVRKVVITDGKRGAGVMENGRWIYAPAFKVKSVDDTGAGDAFVAGMVAGILSEKETSICLKMGLANGASEVLEVGAKTGLMRRGEMVKWMRKKLKIVEEKVTQ